MRKSKEEAVNNFKEKWGLTGKHFYRFGDNLFILSVKKVTIENPSYENTYVSSSMMTELNSLNSILKMIKKPKTKFIIDSHKMNSGFYKCEVFDTYEKLKTYLLINKLAGLK